jgi:uncharacterized metal-binding protein
MEPKQPRCASCGIPVSERICQSPEGRGSGSCPTETSEAIQQAALDEYSRPEVGRFARHASVQEAEGYAGRELGYARLRPAKTRVEEIMAFGRRLGCSRLGLAFCLGLREEARLVEKLFIKNGFEVVSAVCKVGRVPKETLGLTDAEKIAPGRFEAMCNPILQAKILNAAGTGLNVLLGLCVGHDSLFFKYAEAPCTVLAAKDRVMGHNPLAAVYQLGSYYRSLMSGDERS